MANPSLERDLHWHGTWPAKRLLSIIRFAGQAPFQFRPLSSNVSRHTLTMSSWRSVPFQIPEAQLLADLTGVETDLIAVERYCEKFATEQAKDSPDREYLEMACACALIRYGRAFTSGVRTGVPADVFEQFPPEAREWHQYFKDARDKWIAHSVNTFEDNEVCAWLMPPERGPLGVTSITVRQVRVTTLAPEAMDALRILSSGLRDVIKELQQVETAKLLAIAQALPPEPFYSMQSTNLLTSHRSPGKVRSR
jgi:hypothetical protein